MPQYTLLVSPLSRGAFFDNAVEIAQQEIVLMTGVKSDHRQIGNLDLLDIECSEEELVLLSRASCI